MLAAPWSLRIQDEAPLTLVAPVRAHAWRLADDERAPVCVWPGDVAIVCGPDPYTVADEIQTPTQAVIHPGQHCTTVDGLGRRSESIAGASDLGCLGSASVSSAIEKCRCSARLGHGWEKRA